MKIENTYDEVLFAATVGLEPDDADLARIRVPAGEDQSAFLASVRSTAIEIAAMQRAGATGDARQIAEAAQQEYLERFAALLPIPAHTDQKPIADIGSRMFGNGSAELTDTANRMFGRN